jgi:hypothetical protein
MSKEVTGEENRCNHHHHKLKKFDYDVQCFYLEYYVGKGTVAISVLPYTINPDLDVRDVIVMHNFRF